MTSLEALLQHRQICDQLYEAALAEGRFLQQHRRPPEAAMLQHKQDLLQRMDETLAALRAAPHTDTRHPEMRAALDQTRSRILQIMQIEKENEQLILRFSLSRGPAEADAAPAAAPGMLQKIYAKHA
jgi:hypothetical protein